PRSWRSVAKRLVGAEHHLEPSGDLERFGQVRHEPKHPRSARQDHSIKRFQTIVGTDGLPPVIVTYLAYRDASSEVCFGGSSDLGERHPYQWGVHDAGGRLVKRVLVADLDAEPACVGIFDVLAGVQDALPHNVNVGARSKVEAAVHSDER